MTLTFINVSFSLLYSKTFIMSFGGSCSFLTVHLLSNSILVKSNYCHECVSQLFQIGWADYYIKEIICNSM